MGRGKKKKTQRKTVGHRGRQIGREIDRLSPRVSESEKIETLYK